MKVLALYDIHGNVDALEAVLADPKSFSARPTTRRAPADGCWRPAGRDARSIEAALIAPVEPIVVTRLFEELARAA